MLMNGMGDESRAQRQTRIWRSAAGGPLAVVAATGIWQALRSYRSRSGKHLALSFACALGICAVLVTLGSMA
ncbi:hypothetical protein ACWCRD_39095 [Streptomyces sp. NPDC002092]